MKNRIRLQFLGATGFVTGSRSMLEYADTRICVDAGLYQGPRYIEEKNYQFQERSVQKLDGIVLTHAHVDHSGLLPLLVKKGFRQRIYCTPATADLLGIILPDAGRLQEEEYRFLSKKKIHAYNLQGPLFTEEDAMQTLEFLEVVPFGETRKVGGFSFDFHWAGHILGAAHARIEAGRRSILFSGDIGPRRAILHRERGEPPTTDYVVMESTYGSHEHEKEDYLGKMEKAVARCVRRKGMLVIPAFAIGRTQLVLYVLYELIQQRRIPALPIFIDSPMASRATRVYLNYPDEIKPEIIDHGFFDFVQSEQIQLIESVGESKSLNYSNGPGVIISASGMCHGGRIMHHLFNRIWDRRNMILFVGYQAEGTLGRRIIEGASRVKIFDRELPVRATVSSINAFSAHADRVGLREWAKGRRHANLQKFFLNHGEDDARIELRDALGDETEIEMPKNESVYYL